MTQQLRVAYLQKAPSGHTNSCLEALARDGVDLLITLPPTLTDAPHQLETPAGVSQAIPISSWDQTDHVWTEIDEFDPEVVLIVSWDKAPYRRIARRLRGRSLRVLCMDNQWMGTKKQWLGVATSRVFVQPLFDEVFLPGDRQVEFASRLGFRSDAIHTGFYSADVALFSNQDDGSRPRDGTAPFLFVGRLVEDKGLAELVEAFAQYRQLVESPRRLVVAGTGPLAHVFDGIEGVDRLGFLGPVALSRQMQRCSALVLPSRFEPWGVVVHEAVSAGMAVIASDCVGAADDLVEAERNGFIARSGSVEDLLAGLLWWHERSGSEWAEASSLSRTLSQEFSPARWAGVVRTLGDSYRAQMLSPATP